MNPSVPAGVVRAESGPQTRHSFLPPAAAFICFPILLTLFILGFLPSRFLLAFVFGAASFAFMLWRAGKHYDPLHPVRVSSRFSLIGRKNTGGRQVAVHQSRLAESDVSDGAGLVKGCR